MSCNSRRMKHHESNLERTCSMKLRVGDSSGVEVLMKNRKEICLCYVVHGQPGLNIGLALHIF